MRNWHDCHTALHLGVKAKEKQDTVPTLYWLPKLRKNAYKARFIANSSSCTTKELSKVLTSCLTAVKNMLLSTAKRYMKDLTRISWSIKTSGEVLDKLKAKDLNATNLSLYNCSTLYTTLPHNLIKINLLIFLKER